MVGIKKYFISCCLFMLWCSLSGQQNPVKHSDSLRDKSYSYYLKQFEEDISGDHAKIYAEAFLAKAKTEKNWNQTVNAYRIKLHQAAKGRKVFYADSMIIAAKHTGNKNLIGSSYLTKGVVYYDRKDYNNALDNYLIADSYIVHAEDEYLYFKVKYHIAQIKYYLGYYEEAVALFSDCISYFRQDDDIPYLTSLHSLSLCYNRIGNYDLCTSTNEFGIKEATRLEYFDALPRFINSEGINQYFKKNYAISIAKLNETLPELIKSKDISGETVTYFYIGKNYWELNQREKAVTYFHKVDRTFKQDNFMRPDLLENYELLINYYKQTGDMRSLLVYIDQLFLADKYVKINFSYLSGRIRKEYNTTQLNRERNQTKESLRLRENLIIMLVVISAILTILLIYVWHKISENRRRFKKLMERGTKPRKVPESKYSDGNLDINPEVVASVLKQLEKFEEKEKYLAKDITLPKLAKTFNYNIVYVSKIIAHHRQKKFTDYINDLKIEYIIRQLKTNNKFRNYTNKALAEEAGFSTTQHFTRAFFKNAGISPTYFIKRINKSITTGNLP